MKDKNFEELKKAKREFFNNLPEKLQKWLLKTEMEDARLDYEIVGECPVCGSPNLVDCGNTPLNDDTIIVCLDCYSMVCDTCGAILDKDAAICPHWEICDTCAEPKDEDGECDKLIDNCETIQNWLEFYNIRNWEEEDLPK